MRLLIDMDGVCCRTLPYWLTRYNETYGDTLTEEDITSWDIHKFVRPECGYKIYEVLNAPGFFTDLEPYPNVSAVLEHLVGLGHDVVLVTAGVAGSPTALYDKRQWAKTHLPFLHKNNLIDCHRKDLIRGDLLFDDGPRNLASFPGLTCAMDHPYNRTTPTDFRVASWREFEDLVSSLESR